MNIAFTREAWQDYSYWINQDKKTIRKINKLLESIQREGAAEGEGKPNRSSTARDTVAE